MSKVVVVYHSGYGHTGALAEAVAKGARSVADVNVSLLPVADVETRQSELEAADAIIFGTPTYMGGPSAEFAKFMECSSNHWMPRASQTKLAPAFTTSP